MKPTDPPPPKASAGHSPDSPKASAGHSPDSPKASAGHGPHSPRGSSRPGPKSRRPGLHGGYPIRDAAHPQPYDDGVHHQSPGPGLDDPLHNEDVAHEHSDVDIRALVTSAVVLVAVVMASHVLMYLLFGWFEREAAANEPQVSPLARPATEMPATTADPQFSQGVSGPQLLTNEPMALEKFRAMEHTLLHESSLDEKTGVARIPIDEAKKLVLERNLVPVRADSTVPPTLGTHRPAFGEGSGGRAITVPLPEPPAPGTAPAKPQGGH